MLIFHDIAGTSGKNRKNCYEVLEGALQLGRNRICQMWLNPAEPKNFGKSGHIYNGISTFKLVQ